MKTFIMILVLFGFIVCNGQTENKEEHLDAATVVSEFFKAYKSKDHAKVNSLLHPDVVWIQPGMNRVSGVKRSRTEVLQMGKQMSELSAKTIELVDVKVLNSTANMVACILHWKAVQPTGQKLDVVNVDVYTVENGMIVCVRIFSDDIDQEDKFWGNK